MPNIVEEVRRMAKKIAEHAEIVLIDQDGLERLRRRVVELHSERLFESCKSCRDYSKPPDDVHYYDCTETTALYLLVLDAINFCFWPSEFSVSIDGKTYGERSRYQAVAAALKRGFATDVRLHEPAYLSQISIEDVREIFRMDRGEVPMLEERCNYIRDVGRVLSVRFGGRVGSLIEEANHDALELVRLLNEHFQSYKDYRLWRGERFHVLKRAQIFASDLSYVYGGRWFGRLTNLDRLTVFADYRLPQYMRHFGALVYAEELDRVIAAGEVFWGEPEVEIRACTIHAVELMSDWYRCRDIDIPPRLIDDLIWNDRVRLGELSVRPHRTLTTGY